MHSSRMSIAHCSGHLGGGRICLGVGCLPGGVSAWTQRQTGLKTLPFRKLLLRTVIIEVNLLFNVATDEISLQRNVKFVVRLN